LDTSQKIAKNNIEYVKMDIQINGQNGYPPLESRVAQLIS